MTESAAASELEGVDVAGPPDGHPLVLVHGTVLNRTMWAAQREALAEEFRVIVPDLPGHGTRAGEPFRVEPAVERVAEVVERLTDGSVSLVGLSLGGYVATEFARRRPERVEELVLSSSSANPVGALATLTRITGYAALLASKSRLVERWVDGLAERWVRSRELPAEVEEEIVAAGFDLEPFGEAGVEIAGTDFRAAFAAYPGPALVLNGRWDLLMRLGERDHAEAAENVRVEVIDRAGHVCNLDRPGAYTAIVRRFVGAHHRGQYVGRSGSGGGSPAAHPDGGRPVRYSVAARDRSRRPEGRGYSPRWRPGLFRLRGVGRAWAGPAR